ncbi:uncharacterized protein [Nicotiana sylvestris]|uniref:uncharacterized protein n=1 Tax=Nicotiana sylvestris TaxID=4096 RepID=UPI00388CA338
MVGEKVLLNVLAMKGVMRFGKKGKFNPQFIGPFEVLRRIGEVAYELAFPPNLLSVHPVFHVSMLRKYIGDPSHVLDFSSVQLDGELTYDVEPTTILERQVRRLRSKDSFSESAVERLAREGGYLGDRAEDMEQISSPF